MWGSFWSVLFVWLKLLDSNPSGARNQAFIYRQQSWIMTCNAAVVRVNSLELRDQSKRVWAPDQSSWQTQQHCCSASLSLSVSLSVSFSPLSAEAQAIFSPGSSFPTALTTTTTNQICPLNSSLYIAPTSVSILTLQLNPMYSLCYPQWSPCYIWVHTTTPHKTTISSVFTQWTPWVIHSDLPFSAPFLPSLFLIFLTELRRQREGVLVSWGDMLGETLLLFYFVHSHFPKTQAASRQVCSMFGVDVSCDH